MPLSFEGQKFEFQELVTHLKTNRKDIENPEKFVGSLEKEQGVAAADRFFEDETGKWGLFFLISPATNVNDWKVTKSSIPKRLQTFEGRPFISEPNLEHFGAENMEVLEIVKKQDDFRVGIMKKVKYDPKTEEGEVAVLFDKTPFAERVWQDMKDGNAFFVSPAIAGEFEEVNGVRIYKDWIGLHLARVANPAYGTFHASIKATCEGDERTCVQNLIATASVALKSNDTFNFTSFSCANNMSSEEPKFEDTDAGKAIAAISAAQATATDDLNKFKKDVETSFEKLSDTTSDPSPKGKEGIQKSPIVKGETQAQAATDETKPTPKETELAAKVDDLETRADTAEEDLKSRLSDDILETEEAEEEVMGDTPKTAAQEEERKTELGSMDIASLKTVLAAATASLTKVSALAAKFGKPSVGSNFSRVRSGHTPGVGTASTNSNGYKNSKDIKSRLS